MPKERLWKCRAIFAVDVVILSETKPTQKDAKRLAEMEMYENRPTSARYVETEGPSEVKALKDLPRGWTGRSLPWPTKALCSSQSLTCKEVLDRLK